MRIKRDRLEQLKRRGKASLIAEAEVVVAAPPPPADTPPIPVSAKRKWRFDVSRDMDGFIATVIATEV